MASGRKFRKSPMHDLDENSVKSEETVYPCRETVPHKGAVNKQLGSGLVYALAPALTQVEGMSCHVDLCEIQSLS